MTTTVDNTYERYVVSGTGPYAFSFRIFNDTDLTVVAISGSTVVPLTLDSHYTVSDVNDPDGGSITLVNGSHTTYAGYTLDIRSNTPVDQPTNFLNNGRFLPVTHQDAMDYLSRQNQDQDRRASLSPRLPDNEIAPDWPTLLSLANRKGKYGFFFNASTGAPELVSGFSTTAITQGNVGAALYPQTAAEIAAGVTPTNYAYAPRPWIDAARFNATFDGTTDDTIAINNAIASANGKGDIFLAGVAKVTSQITVPAGVRLIGLGFSSTNGTGAGNRGKSGFLRAFTGSNPTVLISGDDAGIDLLDVDNNNQGTGEAIKVTGSRFTGGHFSVRNSGGDGLRLGQTNAGASNTNTNAWYCQYVIACGNASAGMRIDDTNTTTSTSYPLGLANANAGYCAFLDARSNGTDGLQIGNANDNVFGMVVSQSNTGCGIRFKTDGTNSGPRCNHILGNDCEGNTGNDIQIDAATLPAAAPGLYNIVLGNRSVAVSSRIVDNSTGSMVQQWLPGLSFRAYHFGSDVNALAASGVVGFNAYVGANNSPVRFYGAASGTVDGIARISVHKNGGSQTDGIEVNQNAVFKPLTDLFVVTYSASMTIDAATGNIFQITANNGTAFTINAPTNPQTGNRIILQIRNTSGGALGVVTWNAVFKMSAWTSPATGNSRCIGFFYNGSNWIQYDPAGVDVPN